MSQRVPELGRELFGRLGDTDVHRYVLSWPGALTVRVLDYGAVIQSLEAPDSQGVPANVVLGYPTLDEYVANNRPGASRVFFGAVIGRCANRIAGGRFTLDGVEHTLPLNDGPHCLHGGPAGFDTRVWSATELHDAGSVGVRLELVSPDGDQGFPGTVTTSVTYRLERKRLIITYRATTDAPTVLNLTNHTYWNLAGSGDVYGHSLLINADHYCPVDDTLIPLGAPKAVEGTAFDFRRARPIEHGFDHNWVLNGTGPAAVAHDPVSGRTLFMWTTEPGLQFYAGNFLTPTPGAGFALEAQHFPDSPNRPDFPSTVLRPGDVYHQETIFEFPR
ncbi:galactose mutarotase [Lentzea alba]|uniref:aldose epimerase family protein n=1 Tax=Lentzea alba TaxID=2714351 RepID=UPI0039BEED75